MRATCHGISAASGKLGAAAGAMTILYVFVCCVCYLYVILYICYVYVYLVYTEHVINLAARIYTHRRCFDILYEYALHTINILPLFSITSIHVLMLCFSVYILLFSQVPFCSRYCWVPMAPLLPPLQVLCILLAVIVVLVVIYSFLLCEFNCPNVFAVI